MLRHFLCCTLALTCLSSAAAGAEKSPGTALPLGRVVLFSSGVGFFEHSGRVTDDAKVAMKFKTADINDLLKSMVVQDLDGGKVSTVTYGSKDPITKTLKGFSIDLTANPTLAQLLQQLRGERVVFEPPVEVSGGVILGVETRKEKLSEHEVVERSVLNLVTDRGLRAIPLDAVIGIKLANEKLDAELNKALAVLASAHAADKKSVELSFMGKGSRRVRVGYIQATPIWKTTYRLVLSDDKPLLQGWAIVENTSEEDWSGVKLTLISGRPISFTMDLYQPLYIPRPQAQLELYSSLQPQVYGHNLALFNGQTMSGTTSLGASTIRTTQTLGRKVQSSPNAAAGRESQSLSMMVTPQAIIQQEEEEKLGINLRQGVQATAQAGNVGNLFQYAIDAPVSLPRQQSAMLPIVNADVTGEKVSIYNANVHAKHPLYGLRFTNKTDLYLMQGPITVFDGGVYAGDARIEDLPPGGKRLISYGVDLDTEVAPQSKGRPEQLLSVRLLKGTLIAARKYQRATEYTVKNSGKKAKTVLIEYPIDAAWTLVSPKEPAEKTRDLYRFAVEAKPGEPAKLAISEERTERQHVAVTNVDDGTIQIYLSAKAVSEKVKAALAEVVKRKQELQQVAAHTQQLEQQIRDIGEDQARIRQNMAQLDHNTDLYKNYVKKFSNQELEIEKLRGQIGELSDQEKALRKAFDEYLVGLDLE